MAFTVDLHDPFVWLAASGFLLSAIASSLPTPTHTTGFYLFFFNLVNKISVNRNELTQILQPRVALQAPVERVIIQAPLPAAAPLPPQMTGSSSIAK